MVITNTSKQIVAGFGLAVVTLCLGVYFSIRAGEVGGTAVFRLFCAVAVLIVLRVTFAWGRLRGFPATREDGSWALANIVRNLVMSAIVGVVLLAVSSHFIITVFKFAR